MPRWTSRLFWSRGALAVVLALAAVLPAAGSSLGGPNWRNVPITHIDPQIAAGPSHVLIALYDDLYFFDKNGRQITHVGDDPSKPLLVGHLEDLFAPLRADVDAHLELPADARCDPAHRDQSSYTVVIDGPGRGRNRTRQVPNYCLDRFGYDARALYDEYRERFVVVAAAINEAAKCKFNSAANYRARRNKILVAYSASSDPTDGKPWHLSWFDAVPGESCTTERCREENGWQPGTASDYPMIAITKDFLLVTINNQAHERLVDNHCPPDPEDLDVTLPQGVRPRNVDIQPYEDDYLPLPSIVHVRSTRGLASGRFDEQTCRGLCSWHYQNGDIKNGRGLPVVGSPTLANAHGEPHLGSAWFAMPDGTGALDLWRFSIEDTATRPPLRHTRVEIPSFASLDHADSYGRGGQTPLIVNPTNSLVQRSNRLFYADVGAAVESLGSASIRLVELEAVSTPLGDQWALGRHTMLAAPRQGYGSPALEVNDANDMVLVFRRVGNRAASGFGARWLVWKSGETAAPAGQPLANDEIDLPCADAKCEAAGDFDTAGIALAPQGRVYLMMNFIDRETQAWAYAVNYVVP